MESAPLQKATDCPSGIYSPDRGGGERRRPTTTEVGFVAPASPQGVSNVITYSSGLLKLPNCRDLRSQPYETTRRRRGSPLPVSLSLSRRPPADKTIDPEIYLTDDDEAIKHHLTIPPKKKGGWEGHHRIDVCFPPPFAPLPLLSLILLPSSSACEFDPSPSLI